MNAARDSFGAFRSATQEGPSPTLIEPVNPNAPRFVRLAIKPGSKRPRDLEWQHPWTTQDRALPGHNVGLRLDRMTEIDCDSQEAVDWWEKHGQPTPYVSESRPGHRAYWYDGLVSTGTYHWALPDGSRAGEVRSGHQFQCVVPPSVHPDTGQPYRWLGPELTAEAQDVPMFDPAGLPPRHGAGPGDWSRVDPGAILAGVPEGKRDNELFRYASSCRARGLTIEEALVLVTQAAAQCIPPFDAEEAVRKVERVYMVYPDGLAGEEEEDSEHQGLVDLRYLAGLPPPVWMVEPYLAEGAHVCLAAVANTGKTFVALDWSLSLASDGRRVLYLALEGLPGMNHRVEAWRLKYPDLEPDKGLLLGGKHLTLDLLNSGSVARLVTLIKKAGSFDLVVIDNLGEAFPGDENAPEPISRAVAAIKQIRRAAGDSAAILVLHNFGHSAERLRGHSKLIDGLDTILYLKVIPNSDNGLRVWSGKERNSEKFAPRTLRLERHGPGLVAVPGVVSEGAGEVLSALNEGKETVAEIVERTGLGRDSVERRLKHLVDEGEAALVAEAIGRKPARYGLKDGPVFKRVLT